MYLEDFMRRMVVLLFVGLLAASGFAAENADEEIFEKDGPELEDVEMRLWRKSFISDRVGTADDRVHVYAGGFVTFDDNVYLSNNDEQNDTIWTRVGGVDMRFEREERYGVKLAGEWRYYDYADRNDQDHTEYNVNPELYLEFNPMLNLTLEGAFSKTQAPVDVTTVARVENHTNGGGANLQIKPSDIWGVDLDWDIKEIHYKKGAFRSLEYIQNTVSVAPFYMLTEKTKLGAKITHGTTDYEHKLHNEAEWLEGQLSATYLPTEKLALYGSFGYQSREYDHSGTNPDDADFGGLVMTMAAMYDLNEAWKFGGTIARMPMESSAGNFNAYNRISVDATYTPITPLQFTAEFFAEHVDESDTKDSERYGFTVAGTWSLCDFAGTGISYKYRNKDSDALDADYSSNVVSLGLWLTF